MSRKKYDNEFKVMIVDLLESGIKSQQVSSEYWFGLCTKWNI